MALPKLAFVRLLEKEYSATPFVNLATLSVNVVGTFGGVGGARFDGSDTRYLWFGVVRDWAARSRPGCLA